MGLPVILLRLHGCKVGCRGCDTISRSQAHMTATYLSECLERKHIQYPLRPLLITGGEPAAWSRLPEFWEMVWAWKGPAVMVETSGLVAWNQVQRHGHTIDHWTISPKPPTITSRSRAKYGDMRYLSALMRDLARNQGGFGLELKFVTRVDSVEHCREDVRWAHSITLACEATLQKYNAQIILTETTPIVQPWIPPWIPPRDHDPYEENFAMHF